MIDGYIYINDNNNKKNRNNNSSNNNNVNNIYIYIDLCLQETLNLMRKSFKTYFLLGVPYIVCSVNNISQKRIGRKKNLLQPCRPSL